MPVYNETDKSKWTKDGRHYYFKCYYTDLYGNRKQKQSKMYKTSSLAKDEERAFLNKVSFSDDNDVNVTFEKVYNEWLDFKKKLVKSSTFYGIYTRTKSHIFEYFKNKKLHNIKFNHIMEWNSIIEKSNYTVGYQNTLTGYLIEILNFARDNYNFDRKIVSRITKKKVEEVKENNDSENNFWTYEEFTNFIKDVDDNLYNLMFNFLYYTGLRYGEMNALCWNDIDLDRKILSINKNLTNKVLDKTYLITSPKTNNSIRKIDIDDELIERLISHKKQEEKIIDFNNNMFIFGNVKYIPATTFRRKLNYYINKSNSKKITIHGFRHSHASFLINIGCDSREVAERLGDTVQIIEKTYYHMFPKKKKHTIDTLNNFKNKM